MYLRQHYADREQATIDKLELWRQLFGDSGQPALIRAGPARTTRMPGGCKPPSTGPQTRHVVPQITAGPRPVYVNRSFEASVALFCTDPKMLRGLWAGRTTRYLELYRCAAVLAANPCTTDDVLYELWVAYGNQYDARLPALTHRDTDVELALVANHHLPADLRQEIRSTHSRMLRRSARRYFGSAQIGPCEVLHHTTVLPQLIYQTSSHAHPNPQRQRLQDEVNRMVGEAYNSGSEEDLKLLQSCIGGVHAADPSIDVVRTHPEYVDMAIVVSRFHALNEPVRDTALTLLRSGFSGRLSELCCVATKIIQHSPTGHRQPGL